MIAFGARRVSAAMCLALVLALSLVPTGARAFDFDTHVGITEAGALASRLHERLVQSGWPAGLYEPLALLPPASEEDFTLARRIAAFDTAEGLRVLGRKQLAVGWLALGSALERTRIALYGADLVRARRLEADRALADALERLKQPSDPKLRADRVVRVLLALGGVACHAQLAASTASDPRIDAVLVDEFGRAGVPPAAREVASPGEIRNAMLHLIARDEIARYGRVLLGDLARQTASLIDHRFAARAP